MKKYTHRITVPAWITFDLETDNAVPTREEVDEAVDNCVDGVDFSEHINGGTVAVQTQAFDELPEDNERGNRLFLREYHVEDTQLTAADPDISDEVKKCPDCENPTQFGELCSRCEEIQRQVAP